MFEALAEKLMQIFRRLSSRGRLTEQEVEDALREIRLALLEADVNYKVVKELIGRVRERALQAQVLRNISPWEQIVKILYEELVSILSSGNRELIFSPSPPSVFLLVGLQGTGKTTTAAKLAKYLKRSGRRALLVAADPYRPAAGTQLEVLGREINVPVLGSCPSLEEIPERAFRKAREEGAEIIIVDTAGRLHLDEALMEELSSLKSALAPSEILLVADAMTGQEAVKIAQEFHTKLNLTGAILTKMDGDARGGAALSITWVTGVPIKFIGTGEKLDALEPFHPDRIASRILGLGDVQTLVEKVKAAVEEREIRKLEERIRKEEFDLEDLLEQLRRIRKMGSIRELVEALPGFTALAGRLDEEEAERKLRRMEAIILSMTPEERRRPEIIDGSRRRRIARGSGTTPQEVNQLLNQFFEMRRLLKLLKKRRKLLFPPLFMR